MRRGAGILTLLAGLILALTLAPLAAGPALAAQTKKEETETKAKSSAKSGKSAKTSSSAKTAKPAAPAKTKTAAKKTAAPAKKKGKSAAPDPAKAASLREDIAKQKARAQEARETITALTEKERGLHKNLAATEDAVKSAQTRVKAQENVLTDMRAKEDEARREYERLEKEREATAGDLEHLMVTLWPVEVRNMGSRMRGLDTWDEADRHFVWLSAVYGLTDQKLSDLARQSKAMAENVSLRERLNADAARQLDVVNSEKDDLLKKKLAFSRDLAKVRSDKQEGEGELKRVLTTIASLDYQLKILTTVKPPVPTARPKGKGAAPEAPVEEERTVSTIPIASRGSLPWPAEGRIVTAYNPGADPPQRGVGLSTRENAPVTAIAPGKVVHDDILRGLGRVVIVFHGQETYSIYAFLAQSRVRVGQSVERGEAVGQAGFYPAVNGPGLYFELRFHQKAINPMGWLVAR